MSLWTIWFAMNHQKSNGVDRRLASNKHIPVLILINSNGDFRNSMNTGPNGCNIISWLHVIATTTQCSNDQSVPAAPCVCMY